MHNFLQMSLVDDESSDEKEFTEMKNCEMNSSEQQQQQQSLHQQYQHHQQFQQQPTQAAYGQQVITISFYYLYLL